MDTKKRRSVLRKSCTSEFVSVDATPRIKRRISFSGKHLVREFQSEEEPKTWNNSYEISDHLNVDETASNLCVTKCKPLRSSLRKSNEDKENISQDLVQGISQNVNNSILSATKDFINLTSQTSKLGQIENSVELTLCEREKVFLGDGKTPELSFSYAIELRSLDGERTIDIMRELENDVNKNAVIKNLPQQQEYFNHKESYMENHCNENDNIGGVTVYSEFMDEVQYMDFTCSENKRPKEPIKIYMNNSNSPSINAQMNTEEQQRATKDNRKTLQGHVTMEFSPVKINEFDKENIMPTSNVTLNNCCDMEIDMNFLQPPQQKVSVEKESNEFNEKLNKLSFLQDSDDNMQMDITQKVDVNRGAIPKVKSRQTISYNQPIEVSPPKTKSIHTRSTINFNEDIHDLSTLKLNSNPMRQTVYCNEDIKESSVHSNPMRQTVNVNEDIHEVSSVELKSNAIRKTIYFNEAISVSPDKSSQKLSTDQNLNVPDSMRKKCQPPKMVIRKICTPLVNKSKNHADLEQQRILRFKKKLEKGSQLNTVTDDLRSEKAPAAEKSFNVSQNSGISLSPVSSSPLIPPEYNVNNFKQLNDAIERGKIHVYSNADKTPTTDRKAKAACHFSKNLQCFESSKQRRTLVFDNADIPLASDDTLTNAFKPMKSSDYCNINKTQEAIDREKKKNAKCRYSQADDMMLDNTSFLTRAKLGDETASRNSSKRDMTQMNNIDILFDETLKEAASQLGGDLYVKSIRGKNNDTLSSMFYNAKPVFSQTISKIEDNFLDLCDNNKNSTNTQLIRETNLEEYSNDYNKNVENRPTVYLNDDIEADVMAKTSHGDMANRQTHDMEIDFLHDKNTAKESSGENKSAETNSRKTLYLNSNIAAEEEISVLNNEKQFPEKSSRETIFFQTDIECLGKEIINKMNEIPKYFHKTTNQQQQNEEHLSHTMDFDNENIQKHSTATVSEIVNKPQRKTLHLNEEIEQEHNRSKTTSPTLKNSIADVVEPLAKSLKTSRQTMHFVNDDVDIDDFSKDNFNTRKTFTEENLIQTLYLNNDIEEQDLNCSDTNIAKSCRTALLSKMGNNDENRNYKEQTHSRQTMHFDNEVIEKNEELQGEAIRNSNNIKRHTLYLNNDIEVDEQLSNKNTDIKQSTVETLKSSRQTMHYVNNDDDIEISSLGMKEASLVEYVENLKTDGNCPQGRKTLHYHHDINLEKSFEISNQSCVNKFSSEACKTNPHETLYLNSEFNECDENQPNDHKSEMVKSMQPRKSLYTEECMDLTLDSNQSNYQKEDIANKSTQSRKSIYAAQCMDLTLDNVQSNGNEIFETSYPKQKDEKKLSLVVNANKNDKNKSTQTSSDKLKGLDFHNNNDISIDLSFKASAEENLVLPYQPDEKSSKRQTVYYDQEEANINYDMSLVTNDHQHKETTKSCLDNRKTLHFVSDETDANIDQDKETTKSCLDNRKTLQFGSDETGANIENDLSLLKKHINNIPDIENKSSSSDKRKTLHFDNNQDMSIENDANIRTAMLKNSKKSLLYPPDMTPGIKEFLGWEKRCEVDSYMEIEKFTSPFSREDSTKRLPANLTPVLSLAKKRLTLVYDNCSLNEEEVLAPLTPKNIEAHENANNVIENKQTLNDTMQLIDDHQPMDISGIELNASIALQTPPSRARKSRIPIPVSSGKKEWKDKSSASISSHHSHIVKSLREQLEANVDEESHSDSVQVLRRASTFTQRRYTNIEPIFQLPIHEDNPITISDVSEFFVSQRKSNILVEEEEEGAVGGINNITFDPPPAVDTIDISAIERKHRKSFQKPYINLTCDSPLENIDQTHLSLVRTLSDDDEEEVVQPNTYILEQNNVCSESSPKNEPIRQQSESVAAGCNETNVMKFKRRSVSNTGNAASVCRKCRRCQDTFLDETSSSAESFVLPQLPPLPDLGLDRLRRLRKRPHIADVDVLWQRVSLDFTIINTNNESNEESDVDDNTWFDNESNPALKIWRKFENEMKEFEAELVESLEERKRSLKIRPSFVSRLECILSNNSTNWIFDYQMQIRGIYQFSHRKIMTTAVSLIFEEIDPLGIDIHLKSIKLQKSRVKQKNWKPIDFVLEFQLRLGLPFELQSLCESNTEAGIFKMLQTIDQVCLEAVKMGNALQRVVFSNQASIIREGCRTFVRKIIRKIVTEADIENHHVEKIEIKIELLNLKKLSFKDIVTPPLHHFCEDIHLLPVGLQFLSEFLPNPLKYLRCL